MRLLTWVVFFSAGCASIPLPETEAARDLPGTVEIDACVVFSAVQHRRLYEGVAELSFEKWEQAFAAVVLKHPSGVAVIDPPFGYEIADDLRSVPPWFRIISGTAKGKTPAAEGLLAAGIDPREVKTVLLTHIHWDHAGGVRDLPRAAVLLSKADEEYWAGLSGYLVRGTMPHMLEPAKKRLKPFEFDGPPVLRFEASHDVFGDGSVVAVPLPGHTPGSTGYLVRGHGKRWLFTGDATWTKRGIEKPAHKMVRFIDKDGHATGETIGRLHALAQEHPEIALVPAHDAAAYETIPECKLREPNR